MTYKIVEKLVQKAIDKLDNWVVDVAKQTVIGAVEACDVCHSDAFIKAALKSALTRLMVFTVDDSLTIR